MIFAKDVWQDISTRSWILDSSRKIQILPLSLIPNRNLLVLEASLGDKCNVWPVSIRRGSYILLKSLSFVPNGVSRSTVARITYLVQQSVLKIVVGSWEVLATFCHPKSRRLGEGLAS